MRVLGLDPGRYKLGLALLEADGHAVAQRAIMPVAEWESALALLRTWPLQGIALGNATGSSHFAALLNAAMLAGSLPTVPVVIVDERNSTLEARDLYWVYNPPTGWRRMVPRGLLSPPCPVDDFAAAVVARRGYAELLANKQG